MKIIDSKPVTVADAKELLEERKKTTEEMGYEQAQALEHAEKFAQRKPSEAAKLVKELAGDKKLDTESAVKIVDISPKHPETLKAILAKNKIDMSDEEAAEVVNILQK